MDTETRLHSLRAIAIAKVPEKKVYNFIFVGRKWQPNHALNILTHRIFTVALYFWCHIPRIYK